MDRIEVTRGDQRQILINATHDNVAFNLTGYTVRFMVKVNRADANGSAVITKNWGSGCNVWDAATGRIVVELTGADTNLDWRVLYYWDCEAVDSGGNVFTVATGTMVVNRDVRI